MDTGYLKLTCRHCPTQLQGETPDGRTVYFRYRWGLAVVSVNGDAVWSQQLGDDYDGVLDEDIAARIIIAVVDNDEVALALAVQEARRTQGPSI